MLTKTWVLVIFEGQAESVLELNFSVLVIGIEVV